MLLLSTMERCGCSSDKITCECYNEPKVQSERILFLCETIMGQNQSLIQFHEKHEQNLNTLTVKVDELSEIVKEKEVTISQMNNRIQELEQMLFRCKIDPQIRIRVINGLKEDKLFEKLFFELAGTGSFYEGLKVSKPDEFDLNLIMRLPNMPVKTAFKEAQDKSMPTIEITINGAPPGYLSINNLGAVLKYIKENNPTDYAIYKGMEGWCDKNGSLLQSKFRFWMEGLVSKFMN
ncbi:hypothetical protein B566_EDAN018382, partial [Ephemera danica]